MHLVDHSLDATVAASLTQRSDVDLRFLMVISPAVLGPSAARALVECFLAAVSEAALAARMQPLVDDPAKRAPALVHAARATTSKAARSA